MFSVCSGGCSDGNSLKGVNIYIYNSFTLQAWSVSPVQVEFVRQHPPVVAAGLRSVQTPAQLLPDGQRDPEGVRTHQCGDVTGRIQERRVDALRVLHTQITDSYTYIYINERMMWQCWPQTGWCWAGRSVPRPPPVSHTACRTARAWRRWSAPGWRCSAGSSESRSTPAGREAPAHTSAEKTLNTDFSFPKVNICGSNKHYKH